MFGKVIYFDEEKINEYKSALLGKKNIKPELFMPL